jgi:FkbM family methyltransferase
VISYAQNFEDVLLDRVFKDKSSGYYIDIGAMDPIDGSVTKTFYDRGWSGINIEPDIRFFNRLAADRVRDVNLNIAVGDALETRPFYLFEDQGISTFSESFRGYFEKRGKCWSTVDRNVTTLSRICNEHVHSEIDFLKIDAEGWEGPILRGADWANFRPLVLVVEATEPFSHQPAWREWEPFITGECRYIFVYFDGLNRFYIRAESEELRSHFAYPPNVLDEFQIHVMLFKERQAAEAAARAEELLAELAARDSELLSIANAKRSEEQLKVLIEAAAGLTRSEVNRLNTELDVRNSELQRFAILYRAAQSKLDRMERALRRQGSFLKAAIDQKRSLIGTVRILSGQIEAMHLDMATLERELIDSRLWVGRLSEKLAAEQISRR